jgi:D-aspartate ligase
VLISSRRGARASNADDAGCSGANGLGVKPEMPGFVLTTASAYGTLAAVRCLGSYGVPIVIADAQRFAPAALSRHVVRREACPTVRPIDGFIDALLKLGARHPGNVLYATSDDLAWAFAEHQAKLAKHFRLFTPTFSSMMTILDKRSLYAACATVGVPTPKTWFPTNEADVETLTARARFPLIIKPRTQVFFTSMHKGVCVDTAEELRARYFVFARDNLHGAAIAAPVPDIGRPMLQELHLGAPIYSVSGFYDPQRGHFVVRGSRKVLQWPRQAGVGIAFEDAPVDPDLAEGTRRLCDATGFFGVFEAEFVATDAGMQLIDFNPRFFGQLGFDVARGLPSPYFVYLAAMGESAALAREVALAQAWRPKGQMVFQHSAMIAWTRAAERLVGRAPASLPYEGATSVARTLIVDATACGGDRVPEVADRLRQFWGALYHPRSTLRAAAQGYS